MTITDDTKMPNTATFTIQKEDHTLGNLLCRYNLLPIDKDFYHVFHCSQMQRQQHVVFAGYKVPHPLEHSFVLKVQTDKTTTPSEALQRGVDQLIGDLSLLEERLKVCETYDVLLIYHLVDGGEQGVWRQCFDLPESMVRMPVIEFVDFCNTTINDRFTVALLQNNLLYHNQGDRQSDCSCR